MPCSRQNWPVLRFRPFRVPAAGSDGGADGAARAHDEELDRLSAREQGGHAADRAWLHRIKRWRPNCSFLIKTVEMWYVSSVPRKLQLSNRTELTRWPPIGALCDKRQMSPHQRELICSYHSASRKPLGFLVCQLREEAAMSSMVSSAFQPSSFSALEASA